MLKGYQVKGRTTLFFIKHEEMPVNQKKTCGGIVVNLWQKQYDPYQTSLTVGVKLMDLPGGLSPPTTDMMMSKLLFNSTNSTMDEFFMTGYLLNFYLNTTMDRYDCMQIPIDITPQKIIEDYEIVYKVKKIMCEMYGLTQLIN